MDYAALKSEIAGDPAVLGYSGKTDAEIAVLLNDASKRSRNKTSISTVELFEAIDPAEFAVLDVTKQANIRTLLSLGSVLVNGANTRAVLFGAFTAGSATRTALIALAKESISRARELGFPDGLGAGDIAKARAS